MIYKMAINNDMTKIGLNKDFEEFSESDSLDLYKDI